ncbi:MAG: DEAD/DEAH box helicase domain-containing protein, partial [Gemmatimonadaceae bacterium]
MSATPTAATGTAGRANSVAHFLAPHWGRIAERLAPVIDREGGDAGDAPRALICVPDSGAAVELAAALRTARPQSPRILPVTDALRATRLLKASGAPVVIVTPADAERLMAASALALDGLQVVALVAADEMDADQLVNVMAAVPKEARRILIAADATPQVEALLERYFHKAVRMADDATSETTPAALQFQLVRGANAAAHVSALLDELDPPSAVVVTTDVEGVQAALAAHGYPADTDLVEITDGAAPANVALVIFAGLPSATAFETAMTAQPGRAVALVAPRQLAMLKRLAGAAGVLPFAARRATSTARASDDRMRSELKAALAASYPAREIVALEPLLTEFDGVELA